MAKLGSAFVTYSVERWPKEGGIGEAYWITLNVRDPRTHLNLCPPQKVALVNFDSDAIPFCKWLGEMKKLAGDDTPASFNHDCLNRE